MYYIDQPMESKYLNSTVYYFANKSITFHVRDKILLIIHNNAIGRCEFIDDNIQYKKHFTYTSLGKLN